LGVLAAFIKMGNLLLPQILPLAKNYFFLSGRVAAKELGVSDKNIPGALKGRIKSLGGYRFRYATK